jgi:hypothetical protein
MATSYRPAAQLVGAPHDKRERRHRGQLAGRKVGGTEEGVREWGVHDQCGEQQSDTDGFKQERVGEDAYAA